MSTAQLREALDDLADSAPGMPVHAWGPAARTQARRRRRWPRLAALGAPFAALAVALALVLPRLLGASVDEPVAVAPDYRIPATLPAIARTPPTLAERPIRAASAMVGWVHDGRAYTLLLGARGEGYRLLPGVGGPVPQPPSTQDQPDSRCWGGLSPDGTRIACATGFGSVVVTELATGARNVRSAAGLGLTKVAWSPDGRSLAYLEGGGPVKQPDGSYVDSTTSRLHILSATQGAARSYAVAYAAYAVAWSPDSSRVAVSGFDPRSGLSVFEAATGAEQQVVKPLARDAPIRDAPSRINLGDELLFAADGLHLWGVGSDPTSGRPALVSVPLDGKAARAILIQGFTRSESGGVVGLRGSSVVIESFVSRIARLLVVDTATGRTTPLLSGIDGLGPGLAFLGSGNGDGDWRVWTTGIASQVLASARAR